MTLSNDNRADLIFDWNTQDSDSFRPAAPVELDDETLRDGLQSPSVRDPRIDLKKKILHLMDALGIDTADLGLPGAGPRAVADVTALCEEIRDQKLNIRPNCAARTMIRDIEPIARISQEVGIPIEACLFIGSSPIRRYTEEWTLEQMLKLSEDSIRFAVKENLPVMYVTEDTTRADPESLRALYMAAIGNGARRICVCDTVGHATPVGVEKLITFIRSLVEESGEPVKVDWHGHRDRGMDLANTLAALRAGANRVHGCGLGIGERAGNTPMELILVNLKLLGWIDRDLRKLGEYCEAIAEGCGVRIPMNYPVVGQDAFETGTGVHAAAVIKAFRRGDDWLADRVYSGVPATDFGMKQKIRIGPMSGKSNVIYWLEMRGIRPEDPLVERIFAAAKQSDHMLREEEIQALVDQK